MYNIYILYILYILYTILYILYIVYYIDIIYIYVMYIMYICIYDICTLYMYMVTAMYSVSMLIDILSIPRYKTPQARLHKPSVTVES